MNAYLSYAPTVYFRQDNANIIDAASSFAKHLRQKQIPSCFINRTGEIELDLTIRICAQFLNNEVLPIVKLHPGDAHLPIRNLAEVCTLSTLDFIWENNDPAFDEIAILRILDSAGRFRIPMDVQLYFRQTIPSIESLTDIINKIGALADKYGHVQVVKLAEIPSGEGIENFDSAVSDLFTNFVKACPRVKPAVTPMVWLNNTFLRNSVRDFGLVIIDDSKLPDDKYIADELLPVFNIAAENGLPFTPRLPLTPLLYWKGWYSFEVGKVLDIWTDRKSFRPYRDRPAWLEQ